MTAPKVAPAKPGTQAPTLLAACERIAAALAGEWHETRQLLARSDVAALVAAVGWPIQPEQAADDGPSPADVPLFGP